MLKGRNIRKYRHWRLAEHNAKIFKISRGNRRLPGKGVVFLQDTGDGCFGQLDIVETELICLFVFKFKHDVNGFIGQEIGKGVERDHFDNGVQQRNLSLHFLNNIGKKGELHFAVESHGEKGELVRVVIVKPHF